MDVNHLPPVGIEHMDVCALLQEVAALRAEVRGFMTLQAEIGEMHNMLQQKLQVAGEASGEQSPIPANSNTSTNNVNTY